ncbi:alpha/beta fold hydrolase [Isoptericola sp. NPDC019482]|uniref:alpha/beta fold hydrolase n=1 Tax=Isoptericola sp. NPDC019482 TaxID=3154688 RepID=UPI00347596B0
MTASHAVPERPPLQVVRGDRVRVGERDVTWPAFVFVTAEHGTGWVPARFLDDARPVATVVEEYDTRELEVAAGAWVDVLADDRPSRWSWCVAVDGRAGWVPHRVLDGAGQASDGVGPSAVAGEDRAADAVRHLVAGDRTFAYREAGDPAAPPLVLLHAAGESSASWSPLLDDLAALGFRVLALDARGHGDSEWRGEYSYVALWRDVLEVCDVLGVAAATVVGHSMGAATAALLAAAVPERVTRLVLEDATPPRPGGAPLAPFDRPDHPLPFDWPLANALRAERSAPDPAWWAAALTISVPTLIVAGGQASTVDQHDLADLAAALPDARLVEIPVGHMVHDAAPTAFLTAFTEFVRGRGEAA